MPVRSIIQPHILIIYHVDSGAMGPRGVSVIVNRTENKVIAVKLLLDLTLAAAPSHPCLVYWQWTVWCIPSLPTYQA